MFRNSKTYKLLADFLVIIHLAFIVWVVFGAWYLLEHKEYVPIQIVALGLAIVVPRFTGGCPFTLWERNFRLKINPAFIYHQNSFYGHYFFKKGLGIDVTNSQVQLFLATTKIVPTIVALAVVYFRAT